MKKKFRLVSGNFVKNEAHCIERMLDSVQPYVDDSYILIDDTTEDKTAQICESRGCKVRHYSFDNFAKTWNILLEWLSTHAEWGIFIAPDETIEADLGSNLKLLSEKLHDNNIDGAWFSRMHWEDLEMKIEYTGFNSYPDWQLRLLRLDYPRIHLRRYVHELPVGIGRTLRLKEDIHHFNVYWKKQIDYDMDTMYKLYDELKKKEKIEGGKDIWPTQE